MKSSDQILVKKVAIFKALAHPVRFSIVQALDGAELSVHQIGEFFSCDRTTISKHLAVLRESGILTRRKEGSRIYYSLRVVCLPSMLSCVQKIAEGENPEIYFRSNCNQNKFH